MAATPDKRENQRRFAELPNDQRRSLIKAVNRGQAVEVRKHAPLAVGLAQRQQRFWKLSWLMGPALGVFQAVFVGIEVGLINGGIATLGLAALSYWFWSRAHRAEVLNRQIAEGRKAPNRPAASAPKDRSSGGKGRASRSKGEATGSKGEASGSKGRGSWTSRWRFWDRSKGDASTGPAGEAGGADGGSVARGGSGRHLPKATGRLREPPGGRATGSSTAASSGGSRSGGSSDGDASGSSGDGGKSSPPVDPAKIPPGQRPYQPRGKKRRRKR